MSYKTSIENDYLRVYVAAGWVGWSSVNDLAEKQIRRCVNDRCNLDVIRGNLHPVDLAGRNMSMRMHILTAENRLWTLREEYFSALQIAGYGEIVEGRPHIAITHTLRQLKSKQQNLSMKGIVM